MRFLCDMGVSRRIVDWLCEHGHDAAHLRDEGLQRLPNGEIFAKAITENRIVLTFDLDFGELAAMAAGRVASVIVFRLRNVRADHVIERLSVALEQAVAPLEKGAWFKKGSGTFAGTARRVLRTKVPDPFLNHAEKGAIVVVEEARFRVREWPTSEAE